MNPWKPTRVEWISYFALIPFLAFALNYLLFDDRVFNDYRVWLFSFPIIISISLVSWYLHIVAMHSYRLQYPELKETPKRLLVVSVTHVIMTSATFACIFFGYDWLKILGYRIDLDQYKLSVLMAIGLTLVATTLWEAEYVWGQWKKSMAEKQTLEQLAIRQEFETLKNQVNPHFLFNCFNTLSSLINEDSTRAEAFLNELSKVYRYLLRNNEDGLSTLENELRFIQSYYVLLNTRYGDAIQLQIETDPSYGGYLLPSLSLQLLVENAVKHNVVSKQQPLVIDIFTTAGNKLAVNNNLQCKMVKAPSAGIGLENIRSKYELLNEDGFQVLEDEKNFTVVLPLMWNNHSEKRITQLHQTNGIYTEQL